MLTLTWWPWRTNMTWLFCITKMNFLDQCFQKLEHYTQTDRQTHRQMRLKTLPRRALRLVNYVFKILSAPLRVVLGHRPPVTLVLLSPRHPSSHSRRTRNLNTPNFNSFSILPWRRHNETQTNLSRITSCDVICWSENVSQFDLQHCAATWAIL